MHETLRLGLSQKKLLRFYKFAVLTLIIVLVWIVSPLISKGNFQMRGFDLGLRIFATLFWGAGLAGFFDMRKGFEQSPFKKQTPYAFPRFVYYLIGILGFLGSVVLGLLFNYLFVRGLFTIPPGPAILISAFITLTIFGRLVCVSFSVFNEWYEELNG